MPNQKSSPKPLPQVTRGFISAHSPCWLRKSLQKLSSADSEILIETPYKGEVCIRKHSQPLLTQKKSKKTESVPTGKSSTKHLTKVMRGFVSTPNPGDLETVNENWATVKSEIVNETDSKGDVWIHQRPQPLLTKKKSTKIESLPT